MAERNDPYWDPNWVPGSQAVWASATGSLVDGRVLDREEALAALFGSRRRTALGLLAALDAWGTVTAEQAALIVGDRALLDPGSLPVRALYSLGVLGLGRYPQALVRRGAGGKAPGWLYRRANPRALFEDVQPRLSWAEWVHASGGLPWASSTSFDRHNILAAEIALCAAEYLPVGTVLGEKFTRANLLASPTTGALKYTHQADGLIVRSDGLRIALEVTATRSAAFEKKVERWVRFMAANPLDTSGLIVVFVTVPHPSDARRRGAAAEVRKAVSKVMKAHPERSKDAPSSRIGVVDWADWFPDRHMLTEEFMDLVVEFPLGRDAANRWVDVPLMSASFDPDDEFDPLAVVRNSSVLGHVPHWLRTTNPEDVIGTPLTQSGKPLPVMPPARPDLLAVKKRAGGTPKRGMVSQIPARLAVP